ncbi:MAG: hypothetical protein AB7L17_23095 [Ilumatobacteraceae bacterium]
MRPELTPVAAVAAGAVAGAVGTAAMDVLWYSRDRRDGGDEGPLQWEFGGVETWDDTSAPGKLGKRLVDTFRAHPLADRYAAVTQNLVHWGTGAAWGAVFGMAARAAPSRRVRWAARAGVGPVAWLTPYAVLPFAGLYRPIWEYDAKTLWKDLSAHLVFGVATSAAFWSLARLAGD